MSTRWEYYVAEFTALPGPDDLFWKNLDPTWEFCCFYPPDGSSIRMLFKRPKL